MKPVKDAFAAAISSAEKSIRQGGSNAKPTQKERGHVVAKIAESRAKKQKAEAQQLITLAKRAGLSDSVMGEVEAAAKALAYTPETWVFVMLSAAQNDNVIEWLQENSKRPHKAVRVWSSVLRHLRLDTGEIMATRQELAERVGVKADHISEIMSELASINAIRREKDGRSVKYFLNPNIATHLSGTAARSAAREKAGPVKLDVVDGGREVVDSDD